MVQAHARGGSAPSQLLEAGLVARCRAGEQGAWADLVTQYSRYVHAILSRGFSLAESDREDLHQEVFVRIYEHISELRDDEALRPWIGQVTRRLAIDKLRRGGRELPTGEPEQAADPSQNGDPLAEVEEAMDVREALGTLPEQCAEILDRFFARDQSYRTISQELDIPQGTIASRISRCLEKLRIELETG